MNIHYLLKKKPNSSTSVLWVIDSSANEDLTSSSIHLSYYHLVISPRSVALANGFLTKLVGTGSIHLTPNIDFCVFYMFQFPFNFLSTSKITKPLQCSVNFYPSLCIF